MRLSNFKFLFVLSFADKPKLSYLTRPTKKGEKRANCLQKIDTNSNMTFESKMNLKSISVCSKSIKITAILIFFFEMAEIFMKVIQLLIFFCQKIQLKSLFKHVGLFCFDFFEYTLSCVVLERISCDFYR